jgi:hypothetical protein
MDSVETHVQLAEARAENADLRSKLERLRGPSLRLRAKLEAAEGRIDRARRALRQRKFPQSLEYRRPSDRIKAAEAALEPANAEGIASEGGTAEQAANPRETSPDAPSAEAVDQGCPVCGDEGGNRHLDGHNRCPMCLRADTGYRRTSEGLHPRERSSAEAGGPMAQTAAYKAHDAEAEEAVERFHRRTPSAEAACDHAKYLPSPGQASIGEIEAEPDWQALAGELAKLLDEAARHYVPSAAEHDSLLQRIIRALARYRDATAQQAHRG